MLGHTCMFGAYMYIWVMPVCLGHTCMLVCRVFHRFEPTSFQSLHPQLSSSSAAAPGTFGTEGCGDSEACRMEMDATGSL